MKPVVLIGAGGHHKVIKEIIQSSTTYRVEAVLDDRFNRLDIVDEVSYGPVSLIEKWLQAKEKPLFLIAIGLNEARKHLAEKLEQQGASFMTTVHPTAVISPSAVIGEGSVVMANAVINADAVIGKHVIINTGSIIEHDCTVGDYAHLSSGCVVAGGAWIGKSVYLEPGTVILQNEQKEIGSF